MEKLKNKTFLCLSGGRESISGINILKSLGARIYVFDGDENAPARKHADEFQKVNIYDENEVARILKKIDYRSIEGVIALGTDNPRSVSKAKLILNIENDNYYAANISTNKLSMNNLLSELKLKNCNFNVVQNANQIASLIQKNHGKFILKPLDSRGSRGVIQLHHKSDYQKLLKETLSHSKFESCIIEQWIEGPQLSAELIVYESKSYLCGLADRNYPYLDSLFPYIVEDGGQTPSVHSTKSTQEKIEKIADKVAKAIRMKQGTLKFDLVYDGRYFQVIEFATRLSGGGFSTDTIPAVYDYNLVKNVAAMELGMVPDLPGPITKNVYFQMNRFIFPKPGIIDKVSVNIPECLNLLTHEINLNDGDIIEDKISDHTKRRGHINLYANTRRQCENDMQLALSNIVLAYR